MKLQDKVVVVSGGASGLGLNTCQQLAAQGAKIAALDLNQQAGDALANELGEQGLFLTVDITSAEAVEAAVAQVVEHYGRVDICVNCAGVAPGAKVVGRDGAMALEKFAQVININLIGTFNVLRVCAEQMSQNMPDAQGERGVVINVASVAAFDGQMGQSAYSASKGGVVGMTLPLARDLAGLGVRVMTIAPGIFDTPLMKTLDDKIRDPLIQMVQHPKRFGELDEFSALVQHIVENPYLNGETIRLDGGIRMEPR